MKRKIFSTLFALVLVLSFSLVTAVPVAADPGTLNVVPYTLVTSGSATAVWTDADAYTGTQSIKLTTTATMGDYAGAGMEAYSDTIDDITSLSFWYNHASYNGYCGPRVSLSLETATDYYLALSACAIDSTDSWKNADAVSGVETTDWYTTGTGSEIWWYGTWDGSTPGSYVQIGEHITFADLQTALTGADVLSVSVYMGVYDGSGVLQGSAYIDDVEVNGTIYYGSIQDAIDCAVATDTIAVAEGTYTEDLSIPEGKNNLELVGATGATIKGVATEPDASFPLAVPNIDILSSGVKIHGFTIAGPDPVADKYASGMLIGASSVEIYENDFEVTAGRDTFVGPISLAIQSYRKTSVEGVDISGLNIYDNTFTHLATGAGLAGFDGIFINLDTGTTTATIADNEFTGNVARAISTERSNTVISGNSIITDLAPWNGSVGGFQGMFIGCYPVGEDPAGPVQTNVSITGNTVKGATVSDGFAQGIRVGHTTQLGLTNITVSQNTVQDCDEGITVRADATGVTVSYNDITGNTVGVQNDDTGVELDAENNYWGSANGPDHESNTFNTLDQGDEVSDDVDYCPWLDDVYATGASFAPVTSEDGDFSSIQAAIDAATSTTITCAAGYYDESLYIDKSLTVQSEDGAITEGAEWEPVTELSGGVEIALGWDGEDPIAETAVFDGFYIEEQNVPIYLYEVNNGSSLAISNNVLAYYIVGIMSDGFTVDNASSVTIEGNQFLGGEAMCGITFDVVAGGSELIIRDNLIAGNEVGIVFIEVDGSTVTIEEDNIVAGNDVGIVFPEVEHESTVTIAGNTIGEGYSELFEMPLAPNYSGGIFFGGVYDSTITIGGDTRAEGNVIVGNGLDEEAFGGILVEYMGASSLEILNNDILDNDHCGVDIGGFDEDSTVDIHYNSIDDNNYGVNYDSPNTINATCNWWGNVAGPSSMTNPCYWTMGDSVSNSVDYIPWLIQSELAEGWNIWSAPIAGDPVSGAQLQAELVEDGFEAIYYFDSATQFWGFNPDEAGPLDAFYIKMPAESRIRYCIDDEATFPGQKAMKVGWNLIGLASLRQAMGLSDALTDAQWGTGQTELWGYSKVISPSLNGESWYYVREGSVPPHPLFPTEGYWVLMVNDGTLGGFTTTPIVENGQQL